MTVSTDGNHTAVPGYSAGGGLKQVNGLQKLVGRLKSKPIAKSMIRPVAADASPSNYTAHYARGVIDTTTSSTLECQSPPSPSVASSEPTTVARDHYSGDQYSQTVITRPSTSTLPVNGETSKLRVFPDVQISPLVLDRFADIQQLLGRELAKLVTPITSLSDVLWEVKVVGTSKDSAKPALVFTADRKLAKKIRRFFGQQHIRDILGSEEPRLDVHVFGKPPVRLATEDSIAVRRFLRHDEPLRSACGILVKATLQDRVTYGTIGGVLGVDGRLFGMVTAHLIMQLVQTRPAASDHESSDGNSTIEDAYHMADDLDYSDIAPSEPFESDLTSDSCPIPTLEIAKIDANVAAPLQEYSNLDWALIPIGAELWLPNILEKYLVSVGKSISQSQENVPELRIPRWVFGQESKRVIVLSGNGLKAGILKLQHAALMVSPGTSFTKTLTLTVSKGSKLQRGDSGSWVVDEETGEVWGHLVSANAFGDGLVIPIHDFIRDVKQQFQAQAVRFPTDDQIRELRKGIGTTKFDLSRTARPPARFDSHDDNSTVITRAEYRESYIGEKCAPGSAESTAPTSLLEQTIVSTAKNNQRQSAALYTHISPYKWRKPSRVPKVYNWSARGYDEYSPSPGYSTVPQFQELLEGHEEHRWKGTTRNHKTERKRQITCDNVKLAGNSDKAELLWKWLGRPQAESEMGATRPDRRKIHFQLLNPTVSEL
ncbi:hypothetical protein BJ170DRAFT_687683 [Xylariales sp. AK1849]|nr:hypothetical protein BJ170DRAFT_687683 [Xylariales sp. AK1849]